MSPETGTAPSVRASARDTLRVLIRVVLPTLVTGVIVRRPRAMAAMQAWQLDLEGVRVLERMRSRYGAGPLRLRIPGRNLAVVLEPSHVRYILHAASDQFTPANREKQAALGHFQPRGVLISRGHRRAQRRRFHEHMLQTDQPVHDLGPRIADVANEEGSAIADRAQVAGELAWNDFARGWWRLVRRVVLGDTAREDRVLIELLNRLRADANWAFAHPRRDTHRHAFQTRLRSHLNRAEPGSLAAMIMHSDEPEVDPVDQVPHWLFAFDAAAMVAFRTLAVLASHPEQLHAVREELAAADPPPLNLPYLRSCLLESVRLWPTTPVLLRDSVTETEWGGGKLPAGTGMFVFTPLFHRDENSVTQAHRFAPTGWLDGTAPNHPALVPFSDGPGRCPGQDLVLLTTSMLLAAILSRHDVVLRNRGILDPDRPLPASLNHFGLSVYLTPRAEA